MLGEFTAFLRQTIGPVNEQEQLRLETWSEPLWEVLKSLPTD